MPDARALREITDALRALAHRAQDAGSPKLRAFISTLIPVALAEAENAEKTAPPRALRPAQIVRKLGEE